MRGFSSEAALIALCVLFAVTAFAVVDRKPAQAPAHPREISAGAAPNRPSLNIVPPARHGVPYAAPERIERA
jgi:hypothetical protein